MFKSHLNTHHFHGMILQPLTIVTFTGPPEVSPDPSSDAAEVSFDLSTSPSNEDEFIPAMCSSEEFEFYKS